MRTTTWRAIAHPVDETKRLATDEAPRPWRAWAGLALIAVGGSAVYGASLAVAFPGQGAWAGALWVALSAGLGWLVFGPGLVLVSRRSVWVCAHVCMVAMAYGEALLVAGAAVNVALGLAGVGEGAALGFNAGLFLLANVTMGGAVASMLRAVGVPAWRVLLAWVLLLDGIGALIFWALSGVLIAP